MKTAIVLIIGIVIGHFGPITVTKFLANGTSKVLVTSGKVVDSANKMLK
jgi:hypothetical protein